MPGKDSHPISALAPSVGHLVTAGFYLSEGKLSVCGLGFLETQDSWRTQLEPADKVLKPRANRVYVPGCQGEHL